MLEAWCYRKREKGLQFSPQCSPAQLIPCPHRHFSQGLPVKRWRAVMQIREMIFAQVPSLVKELHVSCWWWSSLESKPWIWASSVGAGRLEEISDVSNVVMSSFLFLWHSSSGLSLMKPLFYVLPFPVSPSWQAHVLIAFIRRHLSQVCEPAVQPYGCCSHCLMDSCWPFSLAKWHQTEELVNCILLFFIGEGIWILSVSN